jgi:GTP-binding protein Era
VTGRSEQDYRCGLVAIVGRPSVGKSTLLNALVGARVSITSKKPQTTRHRIAGIVTEPGTQFVFVDTPGFQTRHRSRLNARLNKTVRESLQGIDVALWTVDAAALTAADRAALALVPESVPTIVAINKVDALRDKSALLPRIAEIAALREFAAIVPVSAARGTQLSELKTEIARLLPLSPPLYPADEQTDRDERFMAAEFVREQIFRLLGDEVPYATAVAVDEFVHEKDLRRIRVAVIVEKASQRAILIGEAGERMKAIATAARVELERLFGGRVFLDVWVRVRRGWTDDDAALARFGY